MKILAQIFIIFAFFTFVSCNNGAKSVAGNGKDGQATAKKELVNIKEGNLLYVGEKISSNDALSMNQLIAQMGDKEKMTTKVKGDVEAVCKVKGCWMTMVKPDGDGMRVTFKDYAFFVPKDIAGKKAVVEGTAKINVTPVDELRHYAEDEGLPAEEIAKITEPERELIFEATGVIIEN